MDVWDADVYHWAVHSLSTSVSTGGRGGKISSILLNALWTGGPARSSYCTTQTSLLVCIHVHTNEEYLNPLVAPNR